MDKEDVVHIYNRILLNHKKGTKLSHLLRHGWIYRLSQNEVSQKEKNKYRILTHVCGTSKNVTDEPVCRAEMRHRCREQMYGHQRGKSAVGWGLWCAELGEWN